MDMRDLWRLDGHDQAELVRTGQLTPLDLVEAAITRIEASRPELGAVPITCFDRAIEEAKAADTRPGGNGSPLSAVPFLLKDLGPGCAGLAATAGSALLAGNVQKHDSTLARRFQAGGLRILGKSATAEFGVLPTTEPAHYGPTRNPWARDRSAGGSSGGAAAAVAAGLVPLAHANDAGGSIRIPASCCGVFGLKPTRARTPMGPDVGDLMNGLAAEHVVSRSVRDSAAALDLVAGPDTGDPYWAPPVDGTFLDAVLAPAERPLRIAFTTRTGMTDLDAECVRAVTEAARLCEELGHEVVEDAPAIGIADVAAEFLTVWAAGVSSAVTAQAFVAGRTPHPGLLEPLTWWLYEQGKAVSAAEYLLTITRLQRAARALASFHERHDVLLSAVTAEPAPLLGTFHHGSPQQQLDRALAFAYETPLANLSGQPAMSVPLHRTADGIPVGVQFTGRFGEERTLLSLAAQLEAARPWA
ncbi:amidase [Streptomyces kaniharaensis]|uniref:Amidase n=1 Tax=Streptomyces kaniharaensis TaxID=212423 RepID=A0A6N7KK75_9ACTN|nr:amidase family protein [Streptomyces kaniharaensis]MQS10979.1 amidase [Streptomyces kaniharaensis]